jgi:hypothetical protein
VCFFVWFRGSCLFFSSLLGQKALLVGVSLVSIGNKTSFMLFLRLRFVQAHQCLYSSSTTRVGSAPPVVTAADPGARPAAIKAHPMSVVTIA